MLQKERCILPPKVSVGIPLYGYVPSFAYYRQLRWFIESFAKGQIHGIQASENCYLPWARRDIVTEVIRDGYTHVFFLDQDVVVDSDTVPRLLAHGKKIVGALYYQKVRGHVPVAGREMEETETGWEPMRKIENRLTKVDVIGMGATLIDLRVFKELGEEEAWFDMNARTGEDVEFCKRVRKKGISIWVDPSIDTWHIGATPISRDYFERENWKRRQNDATNETPSGSIGMSGHGDTVGVPTEDRGEGSASVRDEGRDNESLERSLRGLSQDGIVLGGDGR
jgi:hypothetical protein